MLLPAAGSAALPSHAPQSCAGEPSDAADYSFPTHMLLPLSLCSFLVLQSRGADPSILSNPDEDSYLNPGPKSVIDVAVDDEGVRGRLRSLNDKYSSECGWVQLGDVRLMTMT